MKGFGVVRRGELRLSKKLVLIGGYCGEKELLLKALWTVEKGLAELLGPCPQEEPTVAIRSLLRHELLPQLKRLAEGPFELELRGERTRLELSDDAVVEFSEEAVKDVEEASKDKCSRFALYSLELLADLFGTEIADVAIEFLSERTTAEALLAEEREEVHALRPVYVPYERELAFGSALDEFKAAFDAARLVAKAPSQKAAKVLEALGLYGADWRGQMVACPAGIASVRRCSPGLRKLFPLLTVMDAGLSKSYYVEEPEASLSWRAKVALSEYLASVEARVSVTVSDEGFAEELAERGFDVVLVEPTASGAVVRAWEG